MKKKYFLTFLIVLAIRLTSYCQIDSAIYLNNYNDKEYCRFFDSVHTLTKSTIQELKHSYLCWVQIQLNQKGNVHNYDLIEIPDAPLPDIAKKYIVDIFNTTDGRWTFERNSNDTSHNLFFSIRLLKEAQPIEQRVEDIGSTFKFSITILPKLAKKKGYDLSRENLLTFTY